MPIDPEVFWYYQQGREPDRLTSESRLEEARSCRIISRNLGDPPLSVVDVGGAAGHYAFWLASLGYSVHLVEPVRMHLDRAKEAEAESGVRLAGMHEASADALPFGDGQFDAALLFGPLYHLSTRRERIEALGEAHRVLRSGGTLFAMTINRHAGAVEGFFRNLVAKPDFVAMMQQEVATGQHRNPTRRRGLFTTAYFHLPGELREELLEAGFGQPSMVAIESVFSNIPDFDEKWDDPEFRQLLMDTIEQMESEPSVIGMGGHLMGVCRRPDQS